MILLADEIKFRPRLHVTGEAVLIEPVVDLGESASEDFRSMLVHVDIEKLPVAGGGLNPFSCLIMTSLGIN